MVLSRKKPVEKRWTLLWQRVWPHGTHLWLSARAQFKTKVVGVGAEHCSVPKVSPQREPQLPDASLGKILMSRADLGVLHKI